MRAFHWSLVVLFALAYATGNDERLYAIHKLSGIAILGLLLFRIVWGFLGTEPARFATFVKGPRAIREHMEDLAKGRLQPAMSHNPLGGWGVLVLIVLLLIEAVSGLFSSTFDYEGPLAGLISDRWASFMARIHAINFNLLMVMIVAHLVGIVATSILSRENLIGSMITGRKRLTGQVVEPDVSAGWPRVILIATATIIMVWILLALPRLLP